MHWDRTVEIAITSHKVVHVRVLFLEVLQISSRKTQVFFCHNTHTETFPTDLPARGQQILAWTVEEVTITFSSELVTKNMRFLM